MGTLILIKSSTPRDPRALRQRADGVAAGALHTAAEQLPAQLYLRERRAVRRHEKLLRHRQGAELREPREDAGEQGAAGGGGRSAQGAAHDVMGSGFGKNMRGAVGGAHCAGGSGGGAYTASVQPRSGQLRILRASAFPVGGSESET